ncbi:NAD(P)/FAD-dependent oxidoreductase [Rhodococcus tukisamuensis]|uniref:Dehydrogenase (Flavoprotein) n=1 Tax=Rhodococcus tukisamuensis TaxID=168276 RepID=A0A1G6WGW4_9NOCA|nr:hypothetical protein [Rhodococcus tukisamuensis]SDD65051.1 Dehydrogenase (flavoprotein) [Rhodococcus tukisamuensis]
MTVRNEHAVVIGAGVGGLLAARVLSDLYARVTVVERDQPVTEPTARRCVPQGRHAHALLARGGAVMEELFPGFIAELVQCGAVTGDMLANFRWTLSGHRLAAGRSGIRSVCGSRPLVEWQLRNRVRALPGVTITDRCAALGVITDQRRRTVTGLMVSRTAGRTVDDVVDCDLLVDASGRSSQTQAWLESLGYPRPDQDSLTIELAYATRHYRRRRTDLGGDLGIGVGATPEAPRGGAIIAQEDDGWIVTLAGYGADEPPLDPAGFAEFAASLSAPDFGALIASAEPLDDPVRYRIPTAVRRHFDAARLPAHYVPFGDTICCFDPVYGQGMSVAATESLMLRESLETSRTRPVRSFLRAAAPLLDDAWQMSCDTDLRIPTVAGTRTRRTRMANAYAARVHRAAAADPEVGAAFLRVVNLLERPTSLLRPQILARVLRENRPSTRTRDVPVPVPDGLRA